jgi:hypothetical protein
MSVPTFLGSNFYYFERQGVSSMDTVLSDALAQVAANSPAWTTSDLRPGTPAVLLTSPVDASGRFFDILLTNVAGASDLKLECRVRNQNGVTLCTRRINGTASNNWIVRIYSGQFHLYVDIEIVSVAPECVFGGILDLSPEAQNSHTHYCFGGGSRSTADALSSNTWQYAAMVDNVTATLAARVLSYCNAQNTSNTPVLSQSGSNIFKPIIHINTAIAGGNKLAGRRYQCFMGPSGLTGESGKITIPIDVGATGDFRQVLGMTSAIGAAIYVRVP